MTALLFIVYTVMIAGLFWYLGWKTGAGAMRKVVHDWADDLKKRKGIDT